MNELTLNGEKVGFHPGQSILDAARDHGVTIPTLCHLQAANHKGVCRICAVEVEGSDRLLPACSTPAVNGMVVATQTERVMEARRMMLRLLLADSDHDCTVCEAAGDCKLQDLVYECGIIEAPQKPHSKLRPIDDATPLIVRDFNRCVLCGRCAAACNHIQCNDAIPYPYGRRKGQPLPTDWVPRVDYDRCVGCGECVQACPVGALVEKKAKFLARPWQVEKVRTTCPYCGVGCQLWMHVKDGRIVKVTGVEDASPNHGRLCVRGRFEYDLIYSEERLKTPLIRENGGFREASWDEALDLVANKFKKIIATHGPDAVGGVSCSRGINEDSYQMQKFFRAVLGTNNIDNCAHTLHAPTVAGLATSFGSGAMTNSFADFSKAKLILAIGTNMTEAHPVAATFLKNAVANGAELYVVDPRRTALAKLAKLHFPIKAGSDTAFLNGLMHVIIMEDLYDKDYVQKCCSGFEELKAKVLEYPPERAAEISGIPAEQIRNLAHRLAAIKPGMLTYTKGITEHTRGVDNVLSCANLQMLLGNVGIECGGVNPLPGQNNVQGACDMGALPNVFPGYLRVDLEESREKFQEAWGVDRLSDKPGLMMPDMLNALANGTMKAFYVVGENLANVEPDSKHIEHCLASAEFLVCQDIFPTETTRFAHVIFPATAWSENNGTFTNSERRVNRVRTASTPPGIAKANWWIFRELAKRWGHNWESDSARELWDNEISVLAPQLKGIKYARIEGDGLQWPVPDENHCGTSILHKGGCFTCGLGRLIPVDCTPLAQAAGAEYPVAPSTVRGSTTTTPVPKRRVPKRSTGGQGAGRKKTGK